MDCVSSPLEVSCHLTNANSRNTESPPDAMPHLRTPLLCLCVFLATLLSSGTADACASSEEFLQETDTKSALALTPCDPIGFLYLDGLSGDRFFSFAETQKLEEPHIFYGFARTFLNSLARLPDGGADFDNFDDAYASLIMSVTLLQRSDTISEARRKAYSAYAKLAFAQYADLRGTAQTMLVAAIEDEIAGSAFRTRRDLFCFIRHDLPDVPVKTVTSSNAFAECVATEE